VLVDALVLVNEEMLDAKPTKDGWFLLTAGRSSPPDGTTTLWRFTPETKATK
jgi:hypothetical protein